MSKPVNNSIVAALCYVCADVNDEPVSSFEDGPGICTGLQARPLRQQLKVRNSGDIFFF